MIRDITLGQYYPGDSWVHKLDPRTKIIGTFVYLIALFLVKDFWGFLIAVTGILMVVAISRVPLSFILKGLKPVFILSLIHISEPTRLGMISYAVFCLNQRR